MARQSLRRPLTGFVWRQTVTARQSTRHRPPAHPRNQRRCGPEGRCRALDHCSLGYRTVCLALTCLLLAACGAPREPVASSRLVIPAAWRNSVGPGAPVEANWWHAFGDPALSALVEQALRNNTDILTARARVEEYRARLRAIQGDRLPTLEAQINGSRARTLSSVTGLPIHSTVYQGGYKPATMSICGGRSGTAPRRHRQRWKHSRLRLRRLC